MPDVVVTVPKGQWAAWLGEGTLAGDAWDGAREYGFRLGGRPAIAPRERVYVVSHGKLRGYAPLVRVEQKRGECWLIRHAHAVAVTIPKEIKGFVGFRYRWWDYELEVPFPTWRVP